MRHLDLELERLEQRIAPGILGIVCHDEDDHGSKDNTKSKDHSKTKTKEQTKTKSKDQSKSKSN
ncbi:MAG TPA: hypothetical protein VE621_17300 [Bryobacteraceae bacterium]|jgi:hypothetical protein|nr:hypothetical protein [Bryobacteraceae bacterium]